MKKFSDLREKKLKATDYDANIVKSKSGGWLPKITAKGNNDVLYLGTSAFKSKKIAKDAADAYLIGYALGGKKSGEKMVAGHIKNNKKNLVDPSILDFIESFGEETELSEAFAIDKDTAVRMKDSKGKVIYGKVVANVKVNGKPGVEIRWSNKTLGTFKTSDLANVLGDRDADYEIQV